MREGYRKIYILDRNVISSIKKYQENRRSGFKSDKHLLERIHEIRKIDRKCNIISIIFSIWEGEKSSIQSKEDFNLVLEKETKALRGFFKNASNDNNFLEKKADLFHMASSQKVSKQAEDWSDLLLYLNDTLYQPLNEKNKLEVYKNIIKYCLERDLKAWSFVPMLSISALYGNQQSRKLLKFKKGKNNFYNELSDIYLIANFQNLKFRCKDSKNLIFRMMTFDKALMVFSKDITIDDSSYITYHDNGESTFRIKYKLDDAFFPEMKDEQFESYCNIH